MQCANCSIISKVLCKEYNNHTRIMYIYSNYYKYAEGRGRSKERGRYLWSSRKQQGLCACAFPDQAAAKPRGSNTTTEITNI